MRIEAPLILLAAMGLSLLSGCGGKKDGIIPEKELVRLLADLEIAEAYSRHPSGEIAVSRDSLGLSVLKAHGVTSEMLDSTLGWYGRNIDDYSRLYSKVDKELDSRIAKIAKGSVETQQEGMRDIWPYSRFLRIRSNDLSRGFSFSLPAVDHVPGEEIEWGLRVPSSGGVEILLGVEYDDGESRYSNQNIFGNDLTKLKLQTDTARKISRIFGLLRSNVSMPSEAILVDSISLKILPLDSASYYKLRQQRGYKLINRRRFDKKVKEEADSLSKDRMNVDSHVNVAKPVMGSRMESGQFTGRPGEIPPTPDKMLGNGKSIKNK